MAPRIRFSWDISYQCNYRCPYCWWDPHWGHLAEKHKTYPSVEEWLACWRRIHDRHGAVEIEILGGEPLNFPGFADFLVELSEMHYVNTTTNLSVSKESLERLVPRLKKDRVRLGVSYHPHFALFEDFMEKATYLRRSGIAVSVAVVAYPPYLKSLPGYRAACDRADIIMTTWAFTGRYDGKDYPGAYTEEEKGVLKELMPAHRFEYNLERHETLGKSCHTGSLYANIKADGTVYRCGMASNVNKPLGNIFDKDFRLNDGPTPCPVKFCVCSEYLYLDEEMSRREALAPK